MQDVLTGLTKLSRYLNVHFLSPKWPILCWGR